MLNRAIKIYTQNQDTVTLFLYFFIILALAAPFSTMVTSGWTQIRPYIASFGINPILILLPLIGLYFGFLIQLMIDPIKRIQAFLLFSGTIAFFIFIFIFNRWVIVVNTSIIFPLIVGVFVAVFISGGFQYLRQVQYNRTDLFEFRKAAMGLFYLVTVLVVGSFFASHLFPNLNLENRFYINFVNSIIIIFTAYRFVEYEVEKEFFVLGPQRSGKSMLLVGLFLEALSRTSPRKSGPMNPSEPLREMLKQVDLTDREWPLTATHSGEPDVLEFQYLKDQLFPKNVELSTVDYAGEYMSEITNIESTDKSPPLSILHESIRSAEALILIIDMRRFVDGENLHLDTYFEILRENREKQVIIVATKCDLIVDEYIVHSGNQNIESNFEHFKHYVTDRLQRRNQIAALLAEASSNEVHPVYYVTEVTENGRVPLKDESNSLDRVGFNQLLDKIS